ncbi:hypothetical protein [Nodularia sp. NIES-3585]|uniref:hypothetical protein n=1 Tax=Nodularia sp. NIES-3585 TaxID=1973477 RepID=UPI000B6BD982|nr:hypothetical protein [Nodularia sp. NIES-3585]GAX37345.1 hypothetical protein NIES3585_33880 [Nodularia sp. NIES-3585]
MFTQGYVFTLERIALTRISAQYQLPFSAKMVSHPPPPVKLITVIQLTSNRTTSIGRIHNASTAVEPS